MDLIEPASDIRGGFLDVIIILMLSCFEIVVCHIYGAWCNLDYEHGAFLANGGCNSL